MQMAAQSDPVTPPPPYLLGNRAFALRSLGRFSEARESYLGCTAQTQRVGETNGLAACMLGLAGVELELGNLSAAEGWINKAAAVVGTSVPPASPTAMSLRAARGTLAVAQGQRERARTLLDALIAEAKDSALEIGLRARAELNLDEARMADAEADARRALSITQAAQGGVPYSARTGRAWFVLGRVLAQQGDATRANDAFTAALAHLSNTVDGGHPLLVRARQLARS